MRVPKYLKKEISNTKRGEKREEIALKTINSGRTPFSKGDISMDDFVIDVKDTLKSQYILKLKDIEKLHNDANPLGQKPKTGALIIYMGDYILKVLIEKNFDKKEIK